MAALKPLPLSKAKTAYGLISDVVKAVLDEPKRVDMNSYRYCQLPEDGGPRCGTVGCFAGWVSILGRNYRTAVGDGNTVRHATDLLGEDLNYCTGPRNDFVFSSGAEDIVGREGTKKYAQSVARRIRKFQRINAKALKARKLALAR